MIVHVAETGKSFQIECTGATEITTVQNALAKLTGVTVQLQILIFQGIYLDPKYTLGKYDLPQDNTEVFLYSRQSLKTQPEIVEIESDEEIVIEDVEVEVDPGSNEAHILEQQDSVFLRLLPTFEQQFSYHKRQAEATWQASVKRFDACRRLVASCQVQGRAIDVALDNANRHFCAVKAQFDSFMTGFDQESSAQGALIASFNADLEKLGRIELHPLIRTEGEFETLIDCVDVEYVRTAYVDCRGFRDSYLNKVAALKKSYLDLEKGVSKLLDAPPPIDLDSLNREMHKNEAAITEQTTILQSLSTDHERVAKIIEEQTKSIQANSDSDELAGLTSSISPSNNPMDHCAMLDRQNKAHDEDLLPRSKVVDEGLASFMDKCISVKQDITRNVYKQLNAISSIQTATRTVRNHITALRELRKWQSDRFQQIEAISQLPLLYRSCLAEVRRRRAFADLFSQRATMAAEKLGTIWEKEASERESFNSRQQRFFPPRLLNKMGLFSPPPQYEVNVTSSNDAVSQLANQLDREIRAAGGREGEREGEGSEGGVQDEQGLSATTEGSSSTLLSENLQLKETVARLESQLALLQADKLCEGQGRQDPGQEQHEQYAEPDQGKATTSISTSTSTLTGSATAAGAAVAANMDQSFPGLFSLAASREILDQPRRGKEQEEEDEEKKTTGTTLHEDKKDDSEELFLSAEGLSLGSSFAPGDPAEDSSAEPEKLIVSERQAEEDEEDDCYSSPVEES